MCPGGLFFFFLILTQALKSKKKKKKCCESAWVSGSSCTKHCLWEPPPNSGRGWDSKDVVGSAGISGLFLQESYSRLPSVWDSALFTPSVTGCVQASSPALPGNTRPLTAGSSRNHNDLPDAKCILFGTAELQKGRGRNLRSLSICRQITLKTVLAVGFQLPSERRVSHLNNVN